MKIKHKFILIFLVAILTLVFGVNVEARDTHLKKLDFNIVLHENGDMTVTETWDVSFSENQHNVGFKTIDLKGLAGEIIDIRVSQGATEFTYAEYGEKVHDPDYKGQVGTFSTHVYKNELWIEWYINEYDTNKTYTISYRITDAVTVYNDTAELYWQFLGTNFSMNIKKVTGKITIPQGANEENFRVWAHGPLNGTIKRDGTDLCIFEVKNFRAGDMLEVRLAVPVEVFPDSSNTVNKDYLDTILEEEQKYADEANARRKRLMIIGIIDLGVGVLALGFGIVVSILLNIKYKRHAVVDDVEYFRDLPDKTLTPAQASHLYFFYNQAKRNRGNVVSATILELARRKFIYFEEVVEKEKPDLGIYLSQDSPEEEINDLPQDLKSIYELVRDACKEDGYVTLKGLEKYISRNAYRVKGQIDTMEASSKMEFERRNYLDSKSESVRNIVMVVSFLVLFAAFLIMIISNFFVLYAPIGLIIGSVISLISSFGILRLNEEGEQQFVYWNAFGKFIEDFSMMKEYEVPKLVMWEEYMVYAAMMGKAEKAAKQIRTVYKELQDPQYYNTHRSSSYLYYFMYLNSTRGASFNTFGSVAKTFDNINNSATRLSQSKNVSSGRGFGGGFSGGGGGGAGRGGGGFR